MGILKSALKTGAAAKAAQVARREAAKPENQQRAKDLYAKVRGRRKGGEPRPEPKA